MKTKYFSIALSNILSGCAILLFALPVMAGKNVPNNGTGSGSGSSGNQMPKRVAAGCNPSKAQSDLDINNVRTKILGGGDMWWDLNNQKYEIPKGSGLHSLFAGGLWIGGVDAGGQLKLAAMTYRQNGNDFFPGPLDIVTASITDAECLKYDKIWKITRKEVQDFVDGYGSGGSVPTTISTWPGNGNSAQTPFLAPFNDVNGDGIYDPAGAGDYPFYDLNGKASCTSCGNPDYKDLLFGDQTLWWVFNDVGNIHSESGAEPIGLEVQAQAFAFSTNDEINNMTFYQYKVINRSTYQLNDTYFGQWVDPDLGGANDDYVGCDVERGLGYCYNGDSYDEGSTSETGYGFNPPAVGVDFFQGPIADPGDGIDNNKNCIVDEPCEQIVMSKFVYYNNDFTLLGNPQTASHYYNFLKGAWKDGSNMTYGGNGYHTSGPNCDFMFPDASDHKHEWGTGGNCSIKGGAQADWNEVTSGNLPGDRRFIQSAGKFTLTPGAVNYITTGVVWARATSGNNLAAVSLLKQADDKAQALFNNCFKVLNGPDAPDLSLRELENQIILSWSYKASSNNYGEHYNEVDPLIIPKVLYSNFTTVRDSFVDQFGVKQYVDRQVQIDTIVNFDNIYRFQGYQVYQLKDKNVSATDLSNPDKARLILQSDKKDGITTLTNYTFDPVLNSNIPSQKVTVIADKGTTHSLSVTTDQFASGTTTLINHKNYYFTIVAYAFNEYKKYAPDVPINPASPLSPAVDGQKKPYFGGRRNIKTYSAIPHNPAPENFGQQLNCAYGDGPMLHRIEGQGNGGQSLEFTTGTVDELMSAANGYRCLNPVYLKKSGPVSIKVIDPIAVPRGNFEFRMRLAKVADTIKVNAFDSAQWTLTNLSTGQVVSSQDIIKVGYDQLIPEWGLSLNIEQASFPGPLGIDALDNNGFIKDTTVIGDITKNWLSGIPDVDGFGDYNWIRSGTLHVTTANNGFDNDYYDADLGGFDENQIYEKVVVKTIGTPPFTFTGGTWAPYRLCAYEKEDGPPPYPHSITGPAWAETPFNNNSLNCTKINVFHTSPTYNEAITPTNCTPGNRVGGNRMRDLQSVDIVFTSDVSKWTHSLVLESSNDPIAVHGVEKLNPRKAPSRKADGTIDSDSSMSWFPGYAYSLETGERLNIMFAENSSLIGENGSDMLWNPTASNSTRTGETRFGGMHYVYIMNSVYDECAKYKALYAGNTILSGNFNKKKVLREVGWVTIPILSDEKYQVTAGTVFSPPTDIVIKLRVKKPYATYSTAKAGETPKNDNMPLYTFTTDDLFNDKNNVTTAKSALDLINVVPNPYYAYSSYEPTSLDNIIKITNLPSVCSVSIYSINGNLIKKFDRNVSQEVSPGSDVNFINLETSIDWDLTNNARTPIASGIYLIHIKVDGVGERVIKWFGIMRPVDLDSF